MQLGGWAAGQLHHQEGDCRHGRNHKGRLARTEQALTRIEGSGVNAIEDVAVGLHVVALQGAAAAGRAHVMLLQGESGSGQAQFAVQTSGTPKQASACHTVSARPPIQQLSPGHARTTTQDLHESSWRLGMVALLSKEQLGRQHTHLVVVHILHSVGQAARGAHHRHRAVPQRNHLQWGQGTGEQREGVTERGLSKVALVRAGSRSE